MDRQPLTDRLGDRLLAEYGGAAAAYSLRALNGNGDNVVRVRRSSDNFEQDFTALQVSSGEMVNWVNTELDVTASSGTWTTFGGTGSISNATATSFDVDAGASGLDIANLSDTKSVEVGQTYRVNATVSGNLEGSPNIRFSSGPSLSNIEPLELGTGNYDLTITANSATASIRIFNIDSTSGCSVTINSVTFISGNGFVETWYDQSGNGNDATQSVAASQPKIVDGGSLVVGGLDFDGVDDCLETTYGSSEYTSFRVHRYKGSGAGIAYGLGGEVNRHNSSANNTQLTAYFGGSTALTDSGNGATEHLGYLYFNASNSTLHRIAYNDNALSSAGGSTAGTNPLVLMNIGAEKGIGANIFGNTTLKEIIFYDSDKSTERADISDNINAHYNIYP